MASVAMDRVGKQQRRMAQQAARSISVKVWQDALTGSDSSGKQPSAPLGRPSARKRETLKEFTMHKTLQSPVFREASPTGTPIASPLPDHSSPLDAFLALALKLPAPPAPPRLCPHLPRPPSLRSDPFLCSAPPACSPP
eukprot:363694-Chlamydomonas_euryale.AAC.24